MYDVLVQRTNIYLDDDSLTALRALSRARGTSVAHLVREAIQDWIEAQGVRHVEPDEWRRRFDRLLAERRRVYERHQWDPDEVERDVMEAVREVRAERAAGRR